MKIIKSEIDNSVNFVVPTNDGGFFEARYVRRSEDYFICYLSSHSGCSRGCQFCWLTATNQTMMKPARHSDFMDQMERVFNHYKTQPEANTVHFNWMVRGEPLDNSAVDYYLLNDLYTSSKYCGLDPKFKISTIMPRGLKSDLVKRFQPIAPDIYYSLYSMNPDFRAKWLPGAMDPNKALDILADYQDRTNKIIYIHGALIKDENDSLSDWVAIADEIESRDLAVQMNIVRFNPPEGSLYKEADEGQIDFIAKFMSTYTVRPVRIVPRVDPLTFGSCGMFISPEDY